MPTFGPVDNLKVWWLSKRRTLVCSEQCRKP